MDWTVFAVALLGLAGTIAGALVSPLLANRLEVYKLRREQKRDRYDGVKNWVIQIMKVVDPTPIIWRPHGPSSRTESSELPFTGRREALDRLNSEAAKVRLFASGDEQLAQYLQNFISIVNSLSEGPTPKEKEQAQSAAKKVVDRAYKLML